MAVTLVVCESAVAVTTHLRDVAEKPVSLSGHWPRPRALCGAEIAWDTRLPVTGARCRVCREKADAIDALHEEMRKG